jgi:hypothetical protein
MENPASQRAIARPTLVILAGSCAAVLASFAVRWAMARGLSLAGFGLVTLGIALVSAAGGAATLGLTSAAARRVAFQLALGRPGAARGAARTALATAAVAGLLASALLVAAAPVVERTVGPGLSAVLRALAPVAAALAVGGALVGISRGFADTAGRALLRDGLGGALRASGSARTRHSGTARPRERPPLTEECFPISRAAYGPARQPFAAPAADVAPGLAWQAFASP